jgi:S1-C subfamily serine protease
MSIKSITLIAFLFTNTTIFAADELCGNPNQITRNSIVRVEGGNTVGSGVVIGKNHILTAAHVVKNLDEIFVSINGRHNEATMISMQPDLDLALLRVPTGDTAPLKLLKGSPELKDNVWAMGYALGNALVATMGQYKGTYDKKLYTSASVNYGQSGGGLVTCYKGQHVLAGMIKAFGAIMKNGKLERRDDFSVAARSQDIRRFVASNQQLAGVREPLAEYIW